MKFLKLIRNSVFSTLSAVMICAVVVSCAKNKKQTVDEEQETETVVIEDSTFIDSNAKFGRTIATLADLKGAQMFFDNCEYGRYLIKIDSIGIYRNPKNGVVQLGHLTGEVIWGDVPWKAIDVNHSEKFTELGWESIETFHDFTLDDSASQAHMDVAQMNLGTVMVNDYEIVVLRGMEGVEHHSDTKISIAESDLDDLECITYIEWECKNVACSKACEDDGADCNCPGYGFCSYMLGIECMKINCKKKCVRYWPIGYAAWCSCE